MSSKKKKVPGTKITYRQYGKPNPAKDNRASLAKVPTITEESYLAAMADPKAIFMYVSNDRILGVNKLRYKDFPFLLVEPNPVTFYFSTAFDSCDQLQEARLDLDKILKSGMSSKAKDDHLAVAFSYVFKVTSVSIISLFLALEAFLNQQLPDFDLISFRNKLKPKAEVQRYATFEEKLNILSNLSGKSFVDKHPNKLITIIKLKNLRNDLIHLKHSRGEVLTYYDKVYQEILDVDMKRIVNAAKSFINFYYPKLIVNYRKATIIRP